MTGRAKGFAAWRPQRRTEPLLLDIEAVLVEYREYLPLTVRQVFYRLVSKGYPKSESFFGSVQEKSIAPAAPVVSRLPPYVMMVFHGLAAKRDCSTKLQGSSTRTTRSYPTTTSVPGTPTNPPMSRCCVRLRAWSQCWVGLFGTTA